MRLSLKHQRLALSPAEVATRSDAIAARLLDARLIQGKHVAVYLSYQQEVMAEKLFPWLFEHGIQCYLPVLSPDSHHLTFVHYEPDTALQPNRYGILEPISHAHTREPQKLDTVIVPLVAFTQRCERLGTGAGYYDTTFEFVNKTPRPERPRLIGLAYDFQCQPTLVQHPHDVRLDYVVTETMIHSSFS
ncbi:MAG: 5-formyltetrahydrofolate cyclo-ligase [Gammaproteobacteria bacterium]